VRLLTLLALLLNRVVIIVTIFLFHIESLEKAMEIEVFKVIGTK
jgi:hypothetical protein